MKFPAKYVESKSVGTHRFLPGIRPPDTMAAFHEDGVRAEGKFDRLQQQFQTALVRILLQYVQERQTKTTYSMAFRNLKTNSRTVFRDYYARVYAAGRGQAPAFLDPAAQDWVKKAATTEYQFWEKFVRQVHEGEIIDPTQRVLYYVDSLKAVFHAGRVASTPDMIVISWEPDPKAKHCNGCLFLARSGPYVRESLPTTPKAGDCVCKFNCQCTLVYRAAVSRREYMQVRRGVAIRGTMLRSLRSLR
jgi:hypothetical protein